MNTKQLWRKFRLLFGGGGGQAYDFPTRYNRGSCLILRKLYILMKIGDFLTGPLGDLVIC